MSNQSFRLLILKVSPSSSLCFLTHPPHSHRTGWMAQISNLKSPSSPNLPASDRKHFNSLTVLTMFLLVIQKTRKHRRRQEAAASLAAAKEVSRDATMERSFIRS